MPRSQGLALRTNIFTNRNSKIRALHFLNHAVFIYAVFHGTWWWWLAAALVYFLAFGVGVDVGVHRYFSHRAFQAGRPVQVFLACAFTWATIGSTLAWVGMHRKHHRFSDSGQDPHTPFQYKGWLGYLAAYFGFWSSYHAESFYVADLRKDPLHKFFHFYYFLIIFLGVGILLLIHPLAAVFLYSVPAVFCFHGASLIVTVGHGLGEKTYPLRDESRDSIFLHWVTWGEGRHNSHHRYPTRAYYPAEQWYFFDLPGFLIETVFMQKSARTPSHVSH